MSKCINNVPGYNRTIRAPRMQYDIDRALSEASLKEKEFAYHKTQIPATISTYRQVAKEHFVTYHLVMS